MSIATPGIVFLAHAFASLLVLCAFITGGRFVLIDHFGLVIPVSRLLTGIALGIPVLLSLKLAFDEIRQRRRAATLGARLVPRVNGYLPGNLDILVKLLNNWKYGYPSDGQTEWMDIIGPTMNLRVFWEDIIFTAEPENIKAPSDFPNYEKGDKFITAMKSVLGTGVFNSDGAIFHRSMTRPFFSRDRITDFENFGRHSDDVIAQMKERFKQGYAVDFQDAISRFTLDSATEFLFGNDVQSLATGLPYPHHAATLNATHSSPAEDFAVAFAQSQELISQRARIGWIWPLFEIFKDNTAKPMKVVNEFLDPILKEAVDKQKTLPIGFEDKEAVGEAETLLDHLVKLTTDRTVLKDEILNILIAGRDTTAATLTFTVYLLATNPAALTRLREEVLTKVGSSARPTYDNIRDMKYLRAVINETLRLFPAVPFDVRETVHETTWPSSDPNQKPLYIPAKARTAYSVFAMHRRPELWGPDALEFDPDRFLDERVKKYLTKNPFAFLPFNAGPRICLGQQFAYNEMSFMLIRLLQNFDSFALDSEAQPAATRPPASWAGQPGRKGTEKFWPKMHLTMYAHGGLWVRMTEVEASRS
ncbi:cytochrome P450 [Athelia psychrophila]|uniref:Cytochrome P450 n=1 Tax=Athelia psychrophila TaxID=1759441 RepID=A0A166KBC9_9AGAM|nr:cytochrome P450 [Fibularhizoctonia sp. CBS 109695]